MFNSTLLTDYPILQHAIHDRQRDIVEFPYDLWLDNGDQIFDGYFRCFFPPGFIDRDKERAKKVIKDIHDIVQSPVIRYNPEAIHCYVMYHMMEAWFDDEYTKTLDLLPDEVKKFIAGMNREENDPEDDAVVPEQDRIKQWFIDKDSCLGDFEDINDPDYMDETVAEGVAEVRDAEEFEAEFDAELNGTSTPVKDM